MSDEAASDELHDYLERTVPGVSKDRLSMRRLTFRSGHRSELWRRNCIAIGLSAGFLEPLEASAIVLIELSLNALIDNFPASRDTMDVHSKRFNRLFSYRWERIIDFLKLHYVLSERRETYWQDHRRAETIPDRLLDLLRIWKDQPPSTFDLPEIDEIFPAASYQYVLYGMGSPPPSRRLMNVSTQIDLPAAVRQVHERSRALASALPTNRSYLAALREPVPAESAQ